MIPPSDAVHPPLDATLLHRHRDRAGVRWIETRWTPSALRELADSLEAGRPAFERLSAERLREVWVDVLDELVGAGTEAVALRRSVGRLLGLSPPNLDAGLETMVGGVRGDRVDALELFETPRRAAPRPALGVLSATPPALALQILLPALAVRRPVLFKSSSDEPLIAPWLCAALAAREPVLGRVFAAASWPGGSEALDRAAADGAGRVLVYGGAEAIASWRALASDRLVAHGPKVSLAVVPRQALERRAGEHDFDFDLDRLADALARDVALFDQRGCLSVQAVYTDGDAVALADALTSALVRLAVEWPPGPATPEALSAVRQLRDTARMAGRPLGAAERLEAGTVVVDDDPTPRPSPGLRTVRIHPLGTLDELPRHLEPWRGRLQGVAVAGPASSVGSPGGLSPSVAEGLRALGASRIASIGELQAPEAHAWHNGGIDPIDALAG